MSADEVSVERTICLMGSTHERYRNDSPDNVLEADKEYVVIQAVFNGKEFNEKGKEFAKLSCRRDMIK